MNDQLSKGQIVVAVFMAGLGIFIVEKWGDDLPIIMLFLCIIAAFIQFMVALIRWWNGPTPSGRNASRRLRH